MFKMSGGHDIEDLCSSFHTKPPVFGREEGRCEPVSGHVDTGLPGTLNEAILVLTMGWCSLKLNLLGLFDKFSHIALKDFVVEVCADNLGLDTAIFEEFFEGAKQGGREIFKRINTFVARIFVHEHDGVFNWQCRDRNQYHSATRHYRIWEEGKALYCAWCGIDGGCFSGVDGGVAREIGDAEVS